MPKLPTADNLSRVAPRPAGPTQASMGMASGIAANAGNLGRAVEGGFDVVAGALKKNDDEQTAEDVITAHTGWQSDMNDLQRQFQTDNDYQTYGERFAAKEQAIRNKWAQTIRNEKARKEFVLQYGQKAEGYRDRLLDRGLRLKREEHRSKIKTSIDEQVGIYGQPQASPADKEGVRVGARSAIAVGEQQGWLTPAEAHEARIDAERRMYLSDHVNRINSGDAPGLLEDIRVYLKDLAKGRADRLRRTDQSTLGEVSAKYESGGRGVGFVSSGAKDPGGPSYGVHQLSSKDSMPAFLRSPEGREYAAQFEGLRPGTAQFNSVYKDIAERDPEGFAQAQKDFYTRTHYVPARDHAAKLGFNVDDRGVQEALFSISIQHGGAKQVISAARSAANKSPEEQIEALYKARSHYVRRLTDLPGETKASVLNRYKSEVNDAKKLAGTSGEAGPAGPRDSKPDERAIPDDIKNSPEMVKKWLAEQKQDGDAADDMPTQEVQRRNELARKFDVLKPEDIYKLEQQALRATKVQSEVTRRELNKRMDSHLANIRQDGVGSEGFDISSLPQNMQETARKREAQAYIYHDATKDAGELSEGEMMDRQAELREKLIKPGDPDRASKDALVKDIESEYEAVIKARNRDPAAAVESHPILEAFSQTAYRGAESADQWQGLIEARLEAQAALDIEPTKRKVLTKREAFELVPDLRDVPPNEVQSVLQDAVVRAEEAYGPYAKRALLDALDFRNQLKLSPRMVSALKNSGLDKDGVRYIERNAAIAQEYGDDGFMEADDEFATGRMIPSEDISSLPAVPTDGVAGMGENRPMPTIAAFEFAKSKGSAGAAAFDELYGGGAFKRAQEYISQKAR